MGKSWHDTEFYLMRDPKEVFTEGGYQEWLLNLKQLENCVFKVLSDADDLLLGSEDEQQIDVFYRLQKLLESGVLKTGSPNPEWDD